MTVRTAAVQLEAAVARVQPRVTASGRAQPTAVCKTPRAARPSPTGHLCASIGAPHPRELVTDKSRVERGKFRTCFAPPASHNMLSQRIAAQPCSFQHTAHLFLARISAWHEGTRGTGWLSHDTEDVP
ncbi:hypothetical protein LMG28614_07128 [Paraburkholderia ultramafica]|uniref:Uncharacterized protein n=1 Tax=Paraburkholderia ultramafica TaxID=1544867 RepID=A0A6S7BRT2_9BURK|nr:hypothetical protein LMG28614_07128 [Paraburkholderia ultramafica]